jgi:hypothetical protein
VRVQVELYIRQEATARPMRPRLWRVWVSVNQSILVDVERTKTTHWRPPGASPPLKGLRLCLRSIAPQPATCTSLWLDKAMGTITLKVNRYQAPVPSFAITACSSLISPTPLALPQVQGPQAPLSPL